MHEDKEKGAGKDRRQIRKNNDRDTKTEDDSKQNKDKTRNNYVRTRKGQNEEFNEVINLKNNKISLYITIIH